MSWQKLIVYFLMLILLIVSLQRVIVNIFYYEPNNLSSGVVYRVDVFSDGDGFNSRRAFYLKNENRDEYNGVYGEKNDFSLKKNDTVEFRKLYNGSVRVINKNGKKAQNYFGFWDYGSIITLIIILYFYFWFPKWFKKFKSKNHENINY